MQEPIVPLFLSKSTNLFKLFLSDVGLLVSMYADGLQRKLLNREKDINYGAIFENAVAQELRAHGFEVIIHSSSLPSTIFTILFADCATPRSWVIITMVLPISFNSRKSFSTSLPLV